MLLLLPHGTVFCNRTKFYGKGISHQLMLMFMGKLSNLESFQNSLTKVSENFPLLCNPYFDPLSSLFCRRIKISALILRAQISSNWVKMEK